MRIIKKLIKKYFIFVMLKSMNAPMFKSYGRWSKSFEKRCMDQNVKKIDFKPLIKLMKKILPHGMPELPRVHKQVESAMLPNGYIPVETFLKIMNTNYCISDNVKKAMTGNKNDYYFEINVSHLIQALTIPEALTWFNMDIVSGVLMIRSNFEHTISKVKPELIAEEELDAEKIKPMEVFLCCKKTEVDEILSKDLEIRHKSCKFWTNLHPPHYGEDEEEEKNWTKIYLNSTKAIDLGLKFYKVEGRVFCTSGDTKAEGSKQKHVYFKIPCNMFFTKN